MDANTRLLISARDAGAANNLLPVIQLAQQQPGLVLKVVAGHPADRIFRQAGLSIQAITDTSEQVLQQAQTLLDDFQPTRILTGLSGPNCGIDEALLALAGKTPSYALQDFWGDINKGFGEYADTYLVRDSYAAKVTRQRAQVSTFVTGAPARARMPGRLKQRLLSRRLRQRHRVNQTHRLVLLCTQPLWQQPGYHQTLIDALEALPDCHLLVRHHPRDTQTERHIMQRLLVRHCHTPWSISEDRFEALLTASDLLLSAFSNCGLDMALMNTSNPAQAAIPLYLLHNPKLRRLYRDWTGLADHPLSALKISRTLVHRNQLRSAMLQALQQGYRRHSARLAKSHCQPLGAAEKVLHKVLQGPSTSNA